MMKAAAWYAGPLFTLKIAVMELRKINVDQRFEFEDKKTSLPLTGKEAGLYFPAKGTFQLMGIAQWGWLKLKHEETNKMIVVVAEVGLRYVIPIF